MERLRLTICRRTRPGGKGQRRRCTGSSALIWIKAFFVDQQVKFTTDTRGLVEGVVRGVTPIAFGAIQNEVERYKAAGFADSLAVVLPDDVPGYLTGGYSAMKQPKGAPHPNAATVFINWFMSVPGQEIYESRDDRDDPTNWM